MSGKEQIKFRLGIGVISNLLLELGFSKREVLHICADIANKHYDRIEVIKEGA
jgi:hypothetical protein